MDVKAVILPRKARQIQGWCMGGWQQCQFLSRALDRVIWNTIHDAYPVDFNFAVRSISKRQQNEESVRARAVLTCRADRRLAIEACKLSDEQRLLRWILGILAIHVNRDRLSLSLL